MNSAIQTVSTVIPSLYNGQTLVAHTADARKLYGTMSHRALCHALANRSTSAATLRNCSRRSLAIAYSALFNPAN